MLKTIKLIRKLFHTYKGDRGNMRKFSRAFFVREDVDYLSEKGIIKKCPHVSAFEHGEYFIFTKKGYFWKVIATLKYRGYVWNSSIWDGLKCDFREWRTWNEDIAFYYDKEQNKYADVWY